ncbi:hypothetical protein BHF71_10250 [Vulcanibacillus modesticaldus]|uniref:Major facilitator superfamily (MFS) profile domain-containing protein n=1 Tax=Vulcanibacillus modesticaldus TaxID=337097 RepID=A0A1D2YTL4_9BACI|nr:hypothetical protein BHF71_10250 [Vulcanibacillus modesticaldus]
MSVEKKTNINYKLNFLLIFLGRAVSVLGSAIFSFALSLYVLDLTGSAAIFSLLISLNILPSIFVSFFGSVFVDRFDRKKIIVFSDLLSGIAVLIFAIIFSYYPQSVSIFMGYVIIIGVIQGFFLLAVNASIPNIVNEERVASVNSSIQSLQAVVSIIGPILGATLYNLFNMELILIINGISFLLSGISEIFIVFKRTIEVKQDKLTIKSYFNSLKEAIEYLKVQKTIKFLLIFVVIINFIYQPLIIMVITFVTYQVLKVTGFQLALIEGASSLGVILGAIIVSSYKSTNSLIMKFFKLLFIQSALIVLWAFPKLPVFTNASNWVITVIFIFILMLLAMINLIQFIPAISYFQLQIPENLRGRVQGIANTAVMTSAPLGIWAYGLLLHNVNWVYLPIISGIILGIVAYIGSRHRHFKDFVNTLGLESGLSRTELQSKA